MAEAAHEYPHAIEAGETGGDLALRDPQLQNEDHVVDSGIQEQIEAPQNEPDTNTLPQPADVELTSIRDVRIDIRPAGELLPEDNTASLVAAKETVYFRSEVCGADLEHPFYVASPAFCHRPLYFEECCLERYGQTCGVFQPLISAAHFYGTLPALPYKLVVDCPCDCVRAVGPYGPCADGPCQKKCPPLRFDAAMVEAGVVAGLILLIP
jgi:hypothetical protein